MPERRSRQVRNPLVVSTALFCFVFVVLRCFGFGFVLTWSQLFLAGYRFELDVQRLLRARHSLRSSAQGRSGGDHQQRRFVQEFRRVSQGLYVLQVRCHSHRAALHLYHHRGGSRLSGPLAMRVLLWDHVSPVLLPRRLRRRRWRRRIRLRVRRLLACFLLFFVHTPFVF